MSTNSTTLPLNIECFMEDMDVSSKMNREKFEELAQGLISRMAAPLHQALKDSGLTENDIDVVELVGGSTRIPSFKAAIEAVFKKVPSTTLNLDEAVARGCSIQCAMLSHTVKVRDIEVLDAATYPIHISWDSKIPEDGNGEMEVFKRFHSYPFTKIMTFPHRVEPFCFRAFYHENTPLPHCERNIGNFIVNAAAPTESDDTSKVKVKVKVRLDGHGCFSVSSASMVETLPLPPTQDEPMENATPENNTEENTDSKASPESSKDDVASQKSDESDKSNESPSKAEKKEEVKKPEIKKSKKTTKTTELKVDSMQPVPLKDDISVLIEIENELLAQIRHEKALEDAKNAVEEYVYEMRGKIFEIYEKYISDDDRNSFRTLLVDTEDWLYEDGENQPKQVYVDKLAELKKIGQPIVDRYNAYQQLPSAFDMFGSSITHFRKILDLYMAKDEKYSHLEEADMKKVHDKIEEKFKWFNEKMQMSSKSSPTSNPVVYPSQVLSEKKVLDDFCNPIVNKPKPKVEPPPQSKEEVKKDDNKKANPEGEKTEKMETDEKETQAKSNGPNPNLDMEVD